MLVNFYLQGSDMIDDESLLDCLLIWYIFEYQFWWTWPSLKDTLTYIEFEKEIVSFVLCSSTSSVSASGWFPQFQC